MTKPELGEKRDCPECGARFYDLNKNPAHCPKCDHEFTPEALLKPRRTRAEEGGAETEQKTEAAKPAQETSLQSADEEKKEAESKRRAALDEDDEEDSDDEEDLSDIEDIDVDIDDDDNGGLLDDEDDDDDMSTIVKTSGEDND